MLLRDSSPDWPVCLLGGSDYRAKRAVALKAASGEIADAIAFRHLDDPRAPVLRPQDEVDLVYRAALDEYGGARRLQLVAEWLVPAGAGTGSP